MGITRHAIGMGKPRVTGPEAMVETIMDMGIVPFFENPVSGYSIEEMTPAGNWFDTNENLTQTPWDWKIACVESGEIAYSMMQEIEYTGEAYEGTCYCPLDEGQEVQKGFYTVDFFCDGNLIGSFPFQIKK